MIEVVDNPIIISFSEIDAYRQCPFKHMLGYRERWSEPTVSAALQKGNLWHSVMEVHHNRIKALGGKPRTAASMKKAVVEISRLCGLGKDQPDPTEIQELIWWMYDGYVSKWGLDDDWEVVNVEGKEFAPLPNPRGGPSRFLLKVKMDLIIRMRGRLWMVDHKSGKDLPSEKELDLDDQFGLYTWCMRELGTPVMGSIHNAARTQRNKGPMELDARFARTMMNRTDHELNVVAQEAYQTAEKMWPVEFDELMPERTPNTDTCRWRCSFTEACLSSRKGSKVENMLTAHGSTQRPFRDVEIEWAAFKTEQVAISRSSTRGGNGTSGKKSGVAGPPTSIDINKRNTK